MDRARRPDAQRLACSSPGSRQGRLRRRGVGRGPARRRGAGSGFRPKTEAGHGNAGWPTPVATRPAGSPSGVYGLGARRAPLPNVNEAAPAATPPRPRFHRVTRLPVSAPLYGRCLLVEANLCADCGGPDAERIESTLRGSHGGVKGVGAAWEEAHNGASDRALGRRRDWPSSATFTVPAALRFWARPSSRTFSTPPAALAIGRPS